MFGQSILGFHIIFVLKSLRSFKKFCLSALQQSTSSFSTHPGLGLDSFVTDPDQGQRDGVCERHHVLQGGQRHPRCVQCGRLQRLRPAAGRHHAEECVGNPHVRRDSLTKRVNRKGNEGNKIFYLNCIHVIN